jgi:hypothetical protein
MGSLDRFRSTSSMRATFHLNRLICQIPRNPVRMGTKMRTMVAGLSSCDHVEFEPERDRVEAHLLGSRLDEYG